MGVHADTDAYTKAKKLLGIPADEPIFIIRAQDVLSIPAIARYDVLARQLVENRPAEKWYEQIGEVMADFTAWQDANPSKVSFPD